MNQYGTFEESYGSTNDASVESYQGGQPSGRPSLVFDIEDKNSFHEILKLFAIVVVDVWAPYCNPCRMIAPKYVDIANSFATEHNQNLIIFMKDNIQQHDDIHKPDVTVVPTFFLYVLGKRYHIPDFREMRVTIETALEDVKSKLRATQEIQETNHA